jgi:hypothetical protein
MISLAANARQAKLRIDIYGALLTVAPVASTRTVFVGLPPAG